MRLDDEAVSLSHMVDVERIRSKAAHPLSSHAFVSVYLWQKQMGLRLTLLDGAYVVRCAWGARPGGFFLCGEEAAVLDFAAALPPGGRLLYLREQDVRALEAAFPAAFRFERNPCADEYLYSIEEHLALPGRAYANLRTQVHKVERDFCVRTEPIGADNAQDARQIIRQWGHGAHRFAGCDLRDDEVDLTAVAHLSELGMEGVVTYLDGEPMAVSAGFPLTPDTFDIVVSKSRENIQGISYYSKRELMKRVAGRFARINLEEDLGIPGLRQMKLGLQPTGMNRIWEAERV